MSGLAALCYAEVSSKIPISGSAYTYTYATLGELLAWIIGWDLVLEYALGAATVSIGWSGYFANILHQTGISWLAIPPQWANGPHWGLAGQAGVSGFANLPAAGIILVITALLCRGTRESGSVNAVIVAIKLLIVLFFIAIGVGHINGANYHLPPGGPNGLGGYFPFGISGMLGGAAFIFFAYIGFDAVSTTAEEAKNPGRDLPFGIIMSLVICTFLYIVVVAILNGMVPFFKLNVAYPVAFAMNYVGLSWAGVIISIGAIAGLTTVLLVMMFGQSRIFYAMSRDGLIPPSFTRIHPTWRTPIFSTLFFGICIALIAAFTPINIVGSLDEHGYSRRLHTRLDRRTDSPPAPSRNEGTVHAAAGAVYHSNRFGGYGPRTRLLPQGRQPGMVRHPDRLGVVPDLDGRRTRLLLRLRTQQK